MFAKTQISRKWNNTLGKTSVCAYLDLISLYKLCVTRSLERINNGRSIGMTPCGAFHIPKRTVCTSWRKYRVWGTYKRNRTRINQFTLLSLWKIHPFQRSHISNPVHTKAQIVSLNPSSFVASGSLFQLWSELQTRKGFLSLKEVKPWNRFPAEDAKPPALGIFKPGQKKFLSGGTQHILSWNRGSEWHPPFRYVCFASESLLFKFTVFRVSLPPLIFFVLIHTGKDEWGWRHSLHPVPFYTYAVYREYSSLYPVVTFQHIIVLLLDIQLLDRRQWIQLDLVITPWSFGDEFCEG